MFVAGYMGLVLGNMKTDGVRDC